MRVTGGLLKQTRLQKGVSIEQVSDAIKVSIRKLESIEQGCWEDLPRISFIKGYIRAYGAFLEMDVYQLISQFEQEISESFPKNIKSSKLASQKDVGVKTSHLPTRAVEALSILALFFIISVAHKTIVQLQEKNKVAIEKDTFQSQKLEEFFKYDTEETIEQKTKEAFLFSMLKVIPENAVFVSQPREDLFKVVNRHTASVMGREKPVKSSLEEFKQEVLIQAEEELRVSYKIDKKDPFSKTILRGGRLIIKGRESISLRVMGLHKTKIFYNGKQVKIPQVHNSMASLKFP